MDTVQRGISRKWKAEIHKQTIIHTASQVLPPGNWEEFDPFLLMAEDKMKRGAFGKHPHRGIETVTYMIDGELNHWDNKGGKGVLKKGDTQWMTAGRGIIHLEEAPSKSSAHLLQLWVNLPKKDKMVSPRYQDILAETTPIRKEDGVTYRVMSGNSGDVVSPTKNYVPVTMVEILLEPGRTAIQDLPADYNGFIYVLEGKGKFGLDETIGEKGDVLLLGKVASGSHSEIRITADDTLRLVLFAGRPLNEPVVAHGPFVMNTEKEIEEAFVDYESGAF